jgi:TolA-binding protein
VREYPKSESVKEAFFYIGQIFEGAGQKEKAAGYYSKVLNMAPKDQMNIDAMNRIKKIQSAGK